jgi:predicted CopG family antitoxin
MELLKPVNRGNAMALSISVKDNKAEKIVTDAKIKAVRGKVSLSEVVIKLLEKWNKGEIEINGGRNSKEGI